MEAIYTYGRSPMSYIRRYVRCQYPMFISQKYPASHIPYIPDRTATWQATVFIFCLFQICLFSATTIPYSVVWITTYLYAYIAQYIHMRVYAYAKSLYDVIYFKCKPAPIHMSE